MSLTKVSYSMITGAPVNLRDFGAVGDGTTDDTSALQAAITECANNNKTLFVPDGTFMYSNVTVPATKTLSIVGSSRENAVLKQISASTNATAGITATGEFFASMDRSDGCWHWYALIPSTVEA